MGGFLLLTKDPGCSGEKAEDRHRGALDVFRKKQLKVRKRIVRERFVLLAYGKYAFANQDHHEFDNGDFIVSVGTSLYRGGAGPPALKAVHEDFSRGQLRPDDLLGSYCIVLSRGDRLFMFNDYTGLYRVYSNRDRSVLSSSFLAVVKTLPERSLARQEFYEYLFHETSYGGKTLLEGIELLDSTRTWQISPQIASRPKEVVPEQLPGPTMADRVARVSRNLAGYFRTLGDVFGDDVISSLSGGYDTRLMLALERNAGIHPRLFVYGPEDSGDVRVARAIAEGEGLELEHIDKSRFPRVSPDAFGDVVEQNYYLFDGLGCAGVFDNGSDAATRIMRARKARLHLNGGGGEIYRGVWRVPDGQVSLEKFLNYRYGPVHIMEDFVDYSVCGDQFDRRAFTAALGEKMKAVLGVSRDWVTRREMMELYPFFRHTYWLSMNHSLDNQFSYALTPFAELRFVLESFSIPEEEKSSGRFEAALIRALDERLAGYPSVYGFNFVDGVPWPRRAARAVRGNLP
jgi:asparagine synthase (glutamine-hydrolysing)